MHTFANLLPYSNTQTIFYLCSIIWCWYGNVRLGQGCFCFCDRPSGRFSDVRRIAALNFISFFSLVHFVVVVAQSLVCTASLIPLCVRVCVFVSDAVLCIWNERYIFSSCYFIYISVRLVVAFGAQQHWVNSSEPPNSIRRSALTSASNGTTATTDRCYRLNFDAYNCGIYHIHGSIGCLLYGMT